MTLAGSDARNPRQRSDEEILATIRAKFPKCSWLDNEEWTCTTVAFANDVAQNPADQAKVIFAFVRRLKTLIPIHNRDGMSEADLLPIGCFLRDLLETRQALPRDVEFDWNSIDELGTALTGLWHHVKYGLGEDLLDLVGKRAFSDVCPVRMDNSNRETVARFAYELQRIQGKEPIFLPVTDVFAKRLGLTSKMILSLAIKCLVADGFLTQVDRTARGKKHKCRQFRFDVSRFSA